MKLLEILNMMVIMILIMYKFFNKKTGSGAYENEELAQDLHKSVIKNSKEEKSMLDLKIIFGSGFN